MIDIPIPRTRHSPSVKELEFLYNWLSSNVKKGCNVLEFGAGPTTWVIYKAVNSSKYVAVENYGPSVQVISSHMGKMINIVTRLWYDIPEDVKYDVIFVDSSAGYPPGDPNLHRKEAVIYSERLLADDGVFIIHDWHHRSGKAPRRYLESKNYKLVDSIVDYRGVGIYKNVV